MRHAGWIVLAACGTSAPPPPAPVESPPAAPLPVARARHPKPDPLCKTSMLPDDRTPREREPAARPAAMGCAVAEGNVLFDEAAIQRAPDTAPPHAAAAWDHKTPPRYLDRIRRRFDLRADELDRLDKLGVAVPARLAQPSYVFAYHEIFQSELPVYISADSIFHAIFASHDSILAALETGRLAPTLAEALDEMHCALPTAGLPDDTTRDLDTYLVVARTLLSGEPVASALGDDAVEHDAAALVAKATAASELAQVQLFGRDRMIDFTQFTPRGHYADSEDLQRYFRAAMWTSRLEFNLVSRSSRSSVTIADPRETPREALDALALADLASSTGAARHVAQIDQAWAVLAGRREDVSLDQLASFHIAATDPDAFAKLKAAIGGGFRRTTRMHVMPEGTRDLPVIATLLGPRVVPDATALMPLVKSAVPDRETAGIADVAYALGFAPARRFLAGELAKYPTLDHQLDVSRGQLAAITAGDDLYSAWLVAIRALAHPARGALPSFVATDTGADLRMNTIAAAYGQLKHNYVLVAGQTYADFGCNIPEGYVEPAPDAYAALIAYAERGSRAAALLDPSDTTHVKAYFDRTAAVLHILQTIVADELAGRPLTTSEQHWLGQVAELSVIDDPGMTGHPPSYEGWYFDLFFQTEADGMRGADFIADYLTSETGIAYVGATGPRLGVFVVDAGGAPRAFVGPVARAYEVHGPLAARLTDQTAPSAPGLAEPWAASYTLPAPPEPSFKLEHDMATSELVFTSDAALGRAKITVLDHHRHPLRTLDVTLGAGETRVGLGSKKPLEALYLEIGPWRHYVIADSYQEIREAFGAARAAEPQEN
ncbi:MAG TPA: DUF3160 domain-containing protein [Kofleriaceae bacterium]|nr:DUF3160 domain-containing protein [Kofleriaceae bacterium]